MIITTVQIRKLENTGNKMKGICTLVLDGLIAIHDIKILIKPREDSLFFAMPSKKLYIGTREERFVDIVHPINKLAREKLEEIIFALYKIAENMDNTYVTFENTNSTCNNLLFQNAADFNVVSSPMKPVVKTQNKNTVNNDFISKDLKSKIEAWLAE